MKFIDIILIAVIFFSYCFPCADEENISFHEEIVLSISSISTHSDTEDNCSPFCICACCSISFSMEFQNPLISSISSTNSTIHHQD